MRYLSGTPTRQFAVLSFIVIGVITIALCVVISSLLRRDLLDREWTTTSDFVRTEARHNLTPDDFVNPSSAIAQRHFRTFYDETVMMPEIIRVKIYDAQMTVIWSDEPRLIGERFTGNPQLQRALTGRTVVNLEAGEKKVENVYEPQQPQLVEMYVPLVFPGRPDVVGVAETYKQPTAVFRNILRGQIAAVATAVGGAILLYVSLYWVVRGAARRIEQQHRAIEQRSAELVVANQELRTVQGQLVAAERMAAIGEVVTAVAHGIRNPLANIRAAAQVALLDCSTCGESALGPRNMTAIVGEVDRLEFRLRQLLEFVRPARRQNEPVDINAVLRGSCDAIGERIRQHAIVVDMKLAPDLPVVHGDGMLLEQVFVSLLANAVEAIPPGGGTITVTTETASGPDGAVQVVAEIADTGDGIDADELDTIFELFHTSKAQGTGLGLALAKKFVDSHGGTISVRSRRGAGATFRVTLPAAPRS